MWIVNANSETRVVYHLLGKTGWSRVVVNGTRQISKGNFHGNALVPFQRQEIIERTWNEVVIQDGGRDVAGKGKAS